MKFLITAKLLLCKTVEYIYVYFQGFSLKAFKVIILVEKKIILNKFRIHGIFRNKNE